MMFTIRVSCSNCCTESDMQFPLRTRFDQYGFGSESRLVDVTNGYEKRKDVTCPNCGIANLTRLHQVADNEGWQS